MFIRTLWLTVVLATTAVCEPAVTTGSLTKSTFAYGPAVNVAYDVQGSGSVPVVLVHGLAASKEAWNLLTPGFLEVCGCRVYRLDLRGHGDTSAPNDNGYSLVENSRILRAFIANQGLRNVVLVGHSYGGAVSLQTALDAKTEDPGLIQSLVLVSTPGVAQSFPFFISHQKGERYGAVVDRITPAKVRAILVVHGRNPRISKGSRLRVALYSRLWKDPNRTRATRRTATQFLNGGGLRDLAARDHDTAVPTLVVAGTRDHLVRLKRSRELANTIPGARFEVIANSGHALHEDAPEKLVPLLADFLKNPEAPRPSSSMASR